MNKLIQYVVMAAVGVLIFSALLIPFTHSATAETLTVTNEGAYFTTPDDGEHTIIIQHGQITYDGAACVFPDVSLYGSATLMIGDNWFLRCDSGIDPATTPLRYLIAGPPQQFSVIGTIDPATDDALTVTINGAAISATIGDTTVERENLRYTIANTGDFVLSNKPYILDNTPIIGGIRTQTNVGGQSGDIFQIIEGNVGDIENMDATICRLFVFNVGTFAVIDTEFSANTQAVNGDLLKLNSINESAVFGENNEYTANITITYVIVPVTITYDNPEYVGDNLASVIGVIPLIVIVGLIVGIVGVIAVRRGN